MYIEGLTEDNMSLKTYNLIKESDAVKKLILNFNYDDPLKLSENILAFDENYKFLHKLSMSDEYTVGHALSRLFPNMDELDIDCNKLDVSLAELSVKRLIVRNAGHDLFMLLDLMDSDILEFLEFKDLSFYLENNLLSWLKHQFPVLRKLMVNGSSVAL
jgi:hypothetical protein